VGESHRGMNAGKVDRRRGKSDRLNRMKLLEEARDLAILEHNYKKALRKVKIILKSDPNDIDALTLQGGILDLEGKYEKSLKCYERVLAIDRDNTRALIDMGDCHSNLGNVEEALSFYDRALTLLKNNIYYLSKEEELEEAHTGKILLLREQGRVGEARKAVAAALADLPGFRPPRLDINAERKRRK